jgi:hypothetical protein
LNRKRCGIDPPFRRRGFNFSNVSVPSAGKAAMSPFHGWRLQESWCGFRRLVGKSDLPCGKEFAGGRDKDPDDD